MEATGERNHFDWLAVQLQRISAPEESISQLEAILQDHLSGERERCANASQTLFHVWILTMVCMPAGRALPVAHFLMTNADKCHLLVRTVIPFNAAGAERVCGGFKCNMNPPLVLSWEFTCGALEVPPPL